MAKLIRRTLLGAVVAAAVVGGWVGWRRLKTPDLDVAYGPGALQKLDIHLPDGAGPFPYVIDIHGGSFSSGDKSTTAPSAEVLAAGIAVVRINYRLSGTDRWPAAGDDCLEAVRFLTEHGAEHRLDPARMALWGRSAGGFLAVLTAISMAEKGVPPRGVVSFFGPMDFSTMDADMAALGRTIRTPTDGPYSPESALLGYPVGEHRQAAHAMGPIGRLEKLGRIALPPIFIRHGDADPRISDLQANRLRAAWAASDPDATIDYALVPGTGHGGGGFDTDAVLDPMTRFLAEVLG